MNIFEHFEKLINEHGSAAILREHLALVKAEYAALERQYADLKAEFDKLKTENQQIRMRYGNLNALMVENVKTGLACDHCGSPQLKRIGNRTDPIFGNLGIKQAVYRCQECNQETFEAQKT